MRSSCALIIAAVLFTAGCASPPVPTTLSAITENPGQYRNENVELTALVLDNPPPTGDLYRTWTFLIGTRDARILVSEAGYNPLTINKAYHLVEEAVQAAEPVTVTGHLRVGPHKSLVEGAEIDLHKVSYRGITIDTDEGPYVGGFNTPYYYPYYYHRPFYWDHGYYPYGFGWWGEYSIPYKESDFGGNYASYTVPYDIHLEFDE